MTSKKILPPTYLVASIVLMVVFHFLMPLAEVIPYPWQLLGSLPLLLGIVLNLMADKALKIFNTTVKPYEESAALITNGVFGISRHPMYLGMVLMLTGIAILMGSLSPFLLIPVFAMVMDKVFVRIEEAMLANQFGNRWLEYKKTVRKWL